MLYLAEFYLAEDTGLEGIALRAREGATGAASAGADIRFVQAIFVPQDESCFAIFRARSAHEVAAAGRLAGLVFDRIVPAVSIP